jgi:hypothetical protein
MYSGYIYIYTPSLCPAATSGHQWGEMFERKHAHLDFPWFGAPFYSIDGVAVETMPSLPIHGSNAVKQSK